MPSTGLSENKLYVACAGAGKTSLLVKQACERKKQIGHKSVCIISFTTANQDNVRNRLYDKNPEVEVYGWFEFLLRFFARPYKGDIIPELYSTPIRLLYVNEQSGKKYNSTNKTYYSTYAANDLKSKYLSSSGNQIFSDKLSEFCYQCYDLNKSALIKRIETIFDTIFIDEAQDLVGHDFDIIKIIARSQVRLIMAGDPRQYIYDTHPTNKYSNYKGRIDQFCEEKINHKRKRFIELDTTTINSSWRCPNNVCHLANSFMCNYPPMISRYSDSVAQIFAVRESDIDTYSLIYKPIALTWDKNKPISKHSIGRYNWGDSKGLEFESVLVYCTKPAWMWVAGKSQKVGDAEKLYVAITRAKKALAFVVPDSVDMKSAIIPLWREDAVNQLLLF